MTGTLVLAGGVGAARMLAALRLVVDDTELTAIVNTGDDIILHGLHVSPDLDTITYTLAGAVNPETGWGLVGESWAAMEALGRYGGVTWFNLGDQDLATHLYRTQRLADGATLTQATAEIVTAWDLGLRVLPMSDDRVETRVTVAGTEVTFQDYFVRQRHAVPVESIRFDGIENASPGAGVLDAITQAERIIVAPSNPLVSIGPVVAVPGVRDALVARRPSTIAVSPIIGGQALKGPAADMLEALGHEASVVGVARLYNEFAATFVVDTADADRANEIEAAGMACIVTDTIMRDDTVSAALARTVLAAERLEP